VAQRVARRPLETGSHDLPVSAALGAFMREAWAAPEAFELRALAPPERCADRRERLSGLIPDARLVVPAGRAALRGNGQEHAHRAASDYVYLSGDGSPEGVLVLEPDGEAVLYLRSPSGRESDEFFHDHQYGELWVGRRPALEEVEELLGVRCRALAELAAALDGAVETRVSRGVDPEVDALVPAGEDPFPDGELKAVLSELRLVKDDWEIEQMEAAVAATISGFEDVVRAIPQALAAGGERELEAVFSRRARLDGNGVAFDPIVAGGAHATILHWRGNDARLRNGELLLLDAGVESRTLYAGDLTRTLPLGGRFTDVQRRMLELVNDAHEAALGAVAAGRPFRDFHRAAAEVMAEGLADWGVLRVSATEALRDDCGFYRRYTLCTPGHMLGLDVHDCAAARAGAYLDGVLEPGMVLTVEPGLYFQLDDLTLPDELRGIGVRVEDDVVVTATGCRNLSQRLPRRAAHVEAWIEALRDG
jgi:Xaa-Pro aminopeptidase